MEEVQFTIPDQPAKLGEEAEGEGVVTVVDVDVRGYSFGILTIARAGFASAVARFFGARHIDVGDPEFDSRFVVMSDPQSLALQIFNPDRRKEIIRAIREASVVSIHLSTERLRLTVDNSLSTEKDILGLAEATLLFAKDVLG